MFEFASSKKIAVVTGGAGFLGSHLSYRLIAEGFRVIAVDNLVTGYPGATTSLLGAKSRFRVRNSRNDLVFQSPQSGIILADKGEPQDRPQYWVFPPIYHHS